jgi:hypothetical protein
MILSILILLLETLACLGLGATVLHVMRLFQDQRFSERLVVSFILGYGGLGWVLFFLGTASLFGPAVFAVVLLMMASGNIFLLRPQTGDVPPALGQNKNKWLFVPIAALILVLVLDVAEGVSPPADADTLAYHFALAKQFMNAGEIQFVPRAADGAIPLLVQMTYIPALALGGEMALTLWAGVSSWLGAGIIFVFLQRYMPLTWALMGLALLVTTPIVVYGAGSGQVETNMGTFLVAAAFCLLEYQRTEEKGYLILSAALVGFLVASKFTGLVFAASFLPALLLLRVGISNVIWFGIVSVLAGGQWYFWNWVHTGDPVFPMLFGLVGVTDPTFWDEAQNAAFKTMFAREIVVPKTIWGVFSYPVLATFGGLEGLDGAKLGFGPLIVLLAPFVVMALWRYRKTLPAHPLLAVGVIVLLSHVLWFYLGASQRERHLLPVYALALPCILIAAQKWSAAKTQLTVLGAVLAVTLFLQIGAQTIFTAKFVQHVASGEARDDYMRRNVHGFDAVDWVNSNLGSDDRIFVMARNLIYLFDVPVHYGHTADDGAVNISPSSKNGAKFYSQLTRLGITHLLVPGEHVAPEGDERGVNLWKKLVRAECARQIKTVESIHHVSRSGLSGAAVSRPFHVLKLDDTSCNFAKMR